MTAANGSSESNPSTSSGAAPASEPSSIQIQTSPPSPVVSIAGQGSPAAKAADRAERLAAEVRVLDRILVVLTLAFAFFLGSFRASNTDLWMHLGAGRMIAHGEYPFWTGADPFSYMSASGWDNHSWLYDLLTYGIAQAFGGPESAAGGAALVVFKALLVVALAAVMLQIRRRGQSLWLPVIFTSLALLAMSARLLLQPTIVSLLFLALTLRILQRPADLSTAERAALPGWRAWLSSSQRWWLLPVLFGLWVNLDSWFLLGPLTVALFLFGEAIHETYFRAPGSAESWAPGELKRLGLVLLAGIAACLLSPYHVRAFQLPAELGVRLSESALEEDPWFSAFFYSSLGKDYLNPSALELYQNVAHLAFLPLLILGVLSFALNVRDTQLWRVAVFIPFAVLAGWWARAVPLFAVVAGPIAALNFQDFAAWLARRESAPTESKRPWALVGRVATLVGMIALLVLSWGGYLHPNPDDPRFSRHVAWQVPVNDSFRQAALTLADLHQRGVLSPESRGFNLTPDLTCYCAWYCPEEKGFLDLRTNLFSDDDTKRYVTARLELEHRLTNSARAATTRPPRPRDTWPALFRDEHIDHVVLAGPDWTSIRQGILLRFWKDPRQWTMLYGDGRTCIFGWNDPRAAGPRRFAAYEYDPVPHAFGPDLADKDKVPEPVSSESVHKPEWWEAYLRGPEARTPAQDETVMLMEYVMLPESRQQETLAWLRELSGSGGVVWEAMGRGWSGGGTPGALIPGIFMYNPRADYLRPSPGAAAARLLAVRAGRRAVAARPDDAQSYQLLALATTRLADYQRALMYGDSRPRAGYNRLDEIRQVQVANALTQALRLNPDAAESHRMLSDLFFQMHTGNPNLRSHLDMSLDHLHKWVELRTAEIQRNREQPTELIKRQLAELRGRMKQRLNECIRIKMNLKQLPNASFKDDELYDPEEFLKRLRAAYSLKSENQALMVRVRLALEYGLAQQALDLIDEADAKDLSTSKDDVNFILYLLVKSGRADKAAEVEDAEGIIRDNWLSVLLAVAQGDYERADKYLTDRIGRMVQLQRGQMFNLALASFSEQLANPGAFQTIQGIAQTKAEESNLLVIRGVLALEQGDTADAAKQFTAALRTTVPSRETAKVVGLIGTGSAVEGAAYVGAGQSMGEPRFQFDYAPLAAIYLEYLTEAAKAKK